MTFEKQNTCIFFEFVGFQDIDTSLSSGFATNAYTIPEEKHMAFSPRFCLKNISRNDTVALIIISVPNCIQTLMPLGYEVLAIFLDSHVFRSAVEKNIWTQYKFGKK